MADRYSVGYRKPPLQTRFRKGKSGNPKGRPKGSRNLKTDLLEEVEKKIMLKVDGRTQSVSRRQALVKTMVADALRGNPKARALVLSLLSQYEVVEEAPSEKLPTAAEDQKILERFIRRRRRNRSRPAGES